MSSLLTLVSVSGFLDTALKSAAVVLLAMVVAALLGRASAAWRHLVWCLSVASLLLLPVLSLVLPGWRVAWLPRLAANPTPFVAAGQTEPAQTNPTAPLNDAPLAEAAIVVPPSAPAFKTEPRTLPQNVPQATIESTSPPRFAMPWPAIVWLAGGLLSLVPLAIGLWQLGGLHRRSQVIGDHRWLTLLDELRRRLGVRRGVQLRQSESALAPLTWGALRPVLLVPFEAGAWPERRRRLVLLHELAHVRRWDWLTQLIAHVACAVYWFNPLVWLAARQMRIERERACDDIVLASG
ncbi:MAG: M56 family metallopeptidase, partial [Pirellulales bacterium]